MRSSVGNPLYSAYERRLLSQLPTEGLPRHVGVMLDGRRMVHANATHMRVTVETLGEGEYGQRLAAGCTGFGRWTA